MPVVAAVCGMVSARPDLPGDQLAARRRPPAGLGRSRWPPTSPSRWPSSPSSAPGLPTSLRAFLLTLAIVDDLGAILVIALVFTDDVSPSAGWPRPSRVAGLWWLLQRRACPRLVLYLPLGLLCWWCMYRGGVHATIAGVAVGLLTRSPDGARRPTRGSPLDRWEHLLRPVSAGRRGAGVRPASRPGCRSPSRPSAPLSTARSASAIVLGLVVGKTVGMFGGSYLTAARFTRAELARRSSLARGVLASRCWPAWASPSPC